MSIPKKGGYSGGRPASEMGPPANLPSATIMGANGPREGWPPEKLEQRLERHLAMHAAGDRRLSRDGEVIVALHRQLSLALMREVTAMEVAATHAEREGAQEAKAREFARQAREGERLRVAIRSLVNAPEGWHEFNAPNSQGDIVKHHVAFTTTDTLRAALGHEPGVAHGLICLDSPCTECQRIDALCFCGKPKSEHPPGPPCPPPPPPGVMHG